MSKYMKLIISFSLAVLISCSGGYNKEDAKEAENLAVLLDMSIADNYADINKAVEIWKTMPGEVRNSKNPVKNPYDFNIETGDCRKYLEKIDKDIEIVTSLDIPADLEDVINKLRDIYAESCNAISDTNATFDTIKGYFEKSEPAYKALRNELTEIQKAISEK